MDPYLLGLRLAGRRVLVVGGGAVASRRIPVLLGAGADVVLVSPEVTGSLQALAEDGRITWQRRGYQTGDCEGAWLVCACAPGTAVAAAGEEAAAAAGAGLPVNEAVAAEAEQRHIWCVRADNREQSAAWTPATGTAAGVKVGVLSGEPRRSAAIRDAIIRSGLTSTKARPSGRAGAGAAASDVAVGGVAVGGVAIVGGGPGDPGLITVRGRELLAAADVVIADRLAPRALLDELPPDVQIIDAAKIPYGRAMAQESINEALISHASKGRFVVRLKGGDPFVFGRGAEEVLACLEAGIPVTVVPGISSAIGVPTAAGVPVTHRGVSQDFHVVSVHVAPDDERSTVDWAALARSTGTVVLLMAVERIEAIADTLIRGGRNRDSPVSVIADGTLPTQRTIDSTLENVAGAVANQGIRPPAIIVIGDVVGVAAHMAQMTQLAQAAQAPHVAR